MPQYLFKEKGMRLTGTQKKMKELFKEAFAEVLQERRSLLYDTIIEAIEDAAMSKAIKAGKKKKHVPASEINRILKKH
jgi:hypothetical protein